MPLGHVRFAGTLVGNNGQEKHLIFQLGASAVSKAIYKDSDGSTLVNIGHYGASKVLQVAQSVSLIFDRPTNLWGNPAQEFVNDQGVFVITGTVGGFQIRNNAGAKTLFGGTDNGSVAIGGSNLTTNATAGFAGIPNISGPPTGTPESSWLLSGHAPMAFDNVNNRLWIWNTTTSTWVSSQFS